MHTGWMLLLWCLVAFHFEWGDAVGAKLVFQDAFFVHEAKQNTTAPQNTLARGGETTGRLRVQKDAQNSHIITSSSSSVKTRKSKKGKKKKKNGKKGKKSNTRTLKVEPLLVGLLVRDLVDRPPMDDVKDLVWRTQDFYEHAFAEDRTFRDSFRSIKLNFVGDYIYTETFGNFNYLLNLTAHVQFKKANFRGGLNEQVIQFMKEKVDFEGFVEECVRQVRSFRTTISATAIIPSNPAIPTTPISPISPIPPIAPTPIAPTAIPPVTSPVAAPVVGPSPTESPAATIMPTSEGFDITLDLSQVPPGSRDAFVSAADRWTEVITGNLEPVTGTTTSSCGNLVPPVVDDLFICATVEPIDGKGGVLGSAGPEFARFVPTTIPYIGAMRFDSADIEDLEADGSFGSVILHEMGHVLGLGTLWTLNNLQTSAEAGTATPPCPYNANTKASAEYQAISGCTNVAVPVEFGGGPGTQCGHWEEDCLLDELMTGFSTGSLPLSRITVASLEDMGYVVNYDAADPYTAADMNPSCVCSSNLQQEAEKQQKEGPLVSTNLQKVGDFALSTLLFSEKPEDAMASKQQRGNGISSESTVRTSTSPLDQSLMKNATKPRIRGNGRRKLSGEGQQIALDYGKKLLRQNKELKATLPPEDAARYVGDQAVIILYREHGEIYSIEVQGD